MTVAEWCILVAALLPLISIAPAKLSGRAEYDNADPRAPTFYAQGLRARAWGAHLNGYEAFPFFAVAVLVCEMRHVPQSAVDAISIGYTAARIGYVLAYLFDRPTLRSALWGIALALDAR